jgi:riboflavin synthase
MRQVALKGSITIDGVSLTVSGVGETEDGGHWFEVSLIPTTLDETTLGSRQVGAYVNLETDVLAKYVQRLVENGSAT